MVMCMPECFLELMLKHLVLLASWNSGWWKEPAQDLCTA